MKNKTPKSIQSIINGIEKAGDVDAVLDKLREKRKCNISISAETKQKLRMFCAENGDIKMNAFVEKLILDKITLFFNSKVKDGPVFPGNPDND
jgi:hypothetical protein